MKVVFNVLANIRFNKVEVEAASLKEAYDNLEYMTIKDLYKACSDYDFELNTVDGQIVSRNLRVKVYNIRYEDEDYISGNSESPRTRDLPTEWVGDIDVSVDVEAVKHNSLRSADAIDKACDFAIREEIQYEIEDELDFGIKVISFDYTIIDELD